MRAQWEKPIFYRVSATDWFEGEERCDDQHDKDHAGHGEWRFWCVSLFFLSSCSRLILGGRGIQQTTILAKQLKEIGIDLIDVSSGGNYAGQKIPVGPGYQVPFAAHIKKEVPGLTVSTQPPSIASFLTPPKVGAVGLITESVQANEILESNEADVILLARELLRNVDFPLEVAEKLEIAVQPAVQYARAWTRMLKPRPAH
jgi:2,4-dienoyl-CoA reductase-like NADH-dependent reductase (Old Yellow Enzyme family)